MNNISMMNYDEIRSHALNSKVVNSEQQVFNKIKGAKSQKEQLKKVAEEFESVFVTKILGTMDKMVDKEGGLFGGEGKYTETFKSFMFQELGREFASNPRTTFGMAKQIYQQMEKLLPKEG